MIILTISRSHACVEFTKFRQSLRLPLFSKLLLNWTTNEESMRKVGWFSFRAALWFQHWLHKWSIFVRFITSLCQASKFSNLMSFPLASVIVLVFLSFPASMLSFFFLKDQIAPFKWKQIEGSVPCVFHYCVAEIESDYSIMALYKQKFHSEYSVQSTVWKFNMT